MTGPGTSVERAGPSRGVRWGVQFGWGKAGLEDLWWVDQVTSDPAWVRRAARYRMLPVLIPYAVIGVVTGNWAFLVGAAVGVGIVQFLARDWAAARTARAIRNLHGIGDKRSFWADWPASLYFGFNLAVLVVVIGILAVVMARVGDSDDSPAVSVGAVGCVATDGTLEFDALAFNRTSAPQRVTIDFRYVESLGTVVTVPAIATITPDGRQEVVASVEVDADQGCWGTGATVRSNP